MNRIDTGFFLPHASSTLAETIDRAWYVVTGVSIVFGLIVYGALFYFMWKFRRRGPGDVVSRLDHNMRIEVIWTVIPTIVVIALFFVGLQGYIDASVAPGDATEIRVVGEKWRWTFTYPNGQSAVNELRVPRGRPVQMVMSARDVIHSFNIPEFRVKHDAVPGLYTTVWFEATRTGETVLQCTEYCGAGHSDMLAKVIVMEPAAYDEWLKTGGDDTKGLPPAKAGEKLYTKLGCVACHSLDGAKMVGPTFKGVFGRDEALADGSKLKVDDNYVRESILVPSAKVVAGYQPVMPAFKGLVTDAQVDALIAFLKTLK